MENQKKKNFFFLSNWEFFVWNWEKNILFGIGNGPEFRPQNRVIESPVTFEKSVLTKVPFWVNFTHQKFPFSGQYPALFSSCGKH